MTRLLLCMLATSAFCLGPMSRPVRAETCPRGITLTLAPGLHYQDLNVAPAPDIPMATVTADVPVYPGASVSQAPVSRPFLEYYATPYLQTATSEYDISAGWDEVASWYRDAFLSCSYSLAASGTTLQADRIISKGFWFQSTQDSHRSVAIAFEQDQNGGTLVVYLAEDITLPPRPADSYVPSNADRVKVKYYWIDRLSHLRTTSPVITRTSSVHKLITAVNAITDIASGTHLFHFGCSAERGERFRLEFDRRHGGPVVVREDPACQLVFVGHARPLADNFDALWNTVTHIVLRKRH